MQSDVDDYWHELQPSGLISTLMLQVFLWLLLPSLVEAHLLQYVDEDQRDWVHAENEDSGCHGLHSAFDDNQEHQELHQEDGQGLGRELPCQTLVIDEEQEDAEAEGVIHARCANESLKRLGQGGGCFLRSKFHGGHKLASIGCEGCQHEGDVESWNSSHNSNLSKHIHHRVREQKHENSADEHALEGLFDDCLLLLSR